MRPATISIVPAVRPIALALAAQLILGQGLHAATEPNVDLFEKSLKAASEAIRVYGAWDSAKDLRRVAEIGYRVAQEAGFRDFPISFYLIDLAEPNAFALPGGQIFVTRGMLAIGLTDDELAALLGHEIAHVVHRHGVRMERRATLLNVLSQVALVGVMLNADRRSRPDPRLPYPYNVDRSGDGSGDMVTGTYATGIILSELLLRSYSRDFEDEADQEGQKWAAAAGFSRDGTQMLMKVLGSRLPESKEYGYWRTHPFFDQRVSVAEIRAKTVDEGEAKSADEFRSWSQHKILDFGSGIEAASDTSKLVASAALTAWPKGPDADRLRIDRLHESRDKVLSRVPLSRDYGALIGDYDAELDDLRTIDPRSGLIASLSGEREALDGERSALVGQAREVWTGGVYETGFLEKFLSNWPDAPEAPAVALALGEAYSRTGRQAEAVQSFLRAAESEGDLADKARLGLRRLAPTLNQLTALAELANQNQDPDLAAAARKRLAAIVSTYEDIAAGAAYLEAYPDGEHVAAVAQRLNNLADNLYGEVLLYQGVGDHLKAIDRIQKILTYAPASPAAQKLLERVVLPG